MDKVKKKFDEWAINGKAEAMEKEHGKNVLVFIDKINLKKPYTFLDVGCGNGWVVRKIATDQLCKKAVGIDKSKKMIAQAKKNKKVPKEHYIYTGIDEWQFSGKFDFIFSMESLYYVNSIERSLRKIFRLLKPGGQFFCGTDFYLDNQATTSWPKMMKIKMHLHSKQEWKKFFIKAGFETRTMNIKDWKSKKRWKREFGTLFIIGTKPKKESSNSIKKFQ